MIRYFLILTLLISFGCIANSSNEIKECNGCHTSNRLKPYEYFPNGFGKWEDQQCYGCHQEITDIAIKFNSGLKDKRYFALPVSDHKLKLIAGNHLSYLDGPIYPIKNIPGRLSLFSLQRFLKRPFGQCHYNGCNAPVMMAYPLIDKEKLTVYNDKVSKENIFELQGGVSKEEKEKNINIGREIFEKKCVSCHKYSSISGYDSVGLSLFSKKWIYSYANNLHDMEHIKREMPAIKLSEVESEQLVRYFFNQREAREVELDNLLQSIPDKFNKNDNTPLSKSESFYLWNRLWRDNNCVHCHEIKGRANDAFDTSASGLTAWLKENNPFDIYSRLVTRRYEAQLGIGASKPGMPMTKEPVSEQVISLLSRWIKNGCLDLNDKALCLFQSDLKD
ncbi:cytochrome c [uncultured Shewanella sp.]|uniref:c-type cytochrome n=1 Tax=uncultured Shewanella sp. TaxID=173975 RepID=UPI00260829CB|nr:cytochrome c [uncultured Shewanella sp.]